VLVRDLLDREAMTRPLVRIGKAAQSLPRRRGSPTVDRMDIDVFLADSVVGADGTLSVLGAGRTTFSAPSFPFRLARLGVAAMLREPYTGIARTHRVQIQICTSSEDTLSFRDSPGTLPSKEERAIWFDVTGRPPNGAIPGDDHIVPLAINIDGLLLPGPDRYSVVISIDGDETRRLQFRVLETPVPRVTAPDSADLGLE
jgi:hypothetical protein